MAQYFYPFVLPILVILIVHLIGLRVRRWRAKARRTRSDAAGEDACLNCGYSLRGLRTRRCPECGTLAGFTKPIDQLGISEQEARELFNARPSTENLRPRTGLTIVKSGASDDRALREVYGKRAREYERIYERDDTVRQGEQTALAAAIRETFAGRNVLEVACGTGYWTRELAASARRVVATDASDKMLAIAREKNLPADVVEFRDGDAYQLDQITGDFDAGLANFWFSHVPRKRIDEFLDGFHRRLRPGSVVLMADNVFMPEVGGELFKKAGVDDTYKLRRLDDGSEYVVLKNYFDAEQLLAIFQPRARGLSVHFGRCYWWVRYTVAA